MMDRLSQQQRGNDRVTPPLIFLSYAEEDKVYCESFIRHMREPIRQQVFTLWQPYNIEAGLDREHEITTRLQRASLILLMLSADYLADDTCYQQMQQAIEMGQQQPERVCIILLRSCRWRDISGVEQFHALPRNGRFISYWSITYHDDIIQDIVTEIVQLITKVQRANSGGARVVWKEQPEEPSALVSVNQHMRPTETTQRVSTSKLKVSRRATIIGAATVAAIAGASGWVLALLQQHFQGQASAVTFPSQPFTCKGHTDAVNAVTWSPDGKHIVSGSNDKTVRIWNASDGSKVFTYLGHTDMVNAVACSPLHGQRIVSGSSDLTVRVWDISDGGNVILYRGHDGWVYTVAWSPDEKYIASGSDDDTVQVWNASRGSHIFTCTGHSNYVRAVAWSPDGKHIASGSSDHTVQVWNTSDGTHMFTYQGHTDRVRTVAWSPDGQHIASGSDDNTVHIWTVKDGGDVFTYQGHTNIVWSVAWSPNGERIASGSVDTTVQVWNVRDGGYMFTYQGHSKEVRAVAWSPDGRWIASGSDDNTVQVWREM